MKKIILILLIGLSSYYGHAQSLEHERDSLKLSLQNEKNNTGCVLTLATKRMVEKNKNIRLAAAKKTIATLEG